MTETLEDYVNQFGKGLATGFTKLADPVGYGLSYIDKSLTGAGYSNERAVNTIHNQVYKAMYKEPDKKVDSSSYTLRTFGNLVGLTAGYFALASLFIPVVSGVYSLIRTGQKYFHDLSRGEELFCFYANKEDIPLLVKDLKSISKLYNRSCNARDSLND